MIYYRFTKNGEIIAYFDYYVRIFTAETWTEAKEKEIDFLKALYKGVR